MNFITVMSKNDDTITFSLDQVVMFYDHMNNTIINFAHQTIETKHPIAHELRKYIKASCNNVTTLGE